MHEWRLDIGGSYENPQPYAYCVCGCGSKVDAGEIEDFLNRRVRQTGNVVQFDVHADLIRDALAMPEETIIRQIALRKDFPDTFTFFVEHPDFDEVGEDERLPMISPIIHADYEKQPRTWLTWEWGDKIDKE